jgi:hypothetical protein
LDVHEFGSGLTMAEAHRILDLRYQLAVFYSTYIPSDKFSSAKGMVAFAGYQCIYKMLESKMIFRSFVGK